MGTLKKPSGLCLYLNEPTLQQKKLKDPFSNVQHGSIDPLFEEIFQFSSKRQLRVQREKLTLFLSQCAEVNRKRHDLSRNAIVIRFKFSACQNKEQSSARIIFLVSLPMTLNSKKNIEAGFSGFSPSCLTPWANIEI